MESACRSSGKPSLSGSKVAYLDIEESTSSEYQRVFAEFAQHPPDAIDAIQFVVLEFDEEDARQAGAIRALLASKGTPIGPYDVLIAGQAVVWNLILVTHITQEFGRVPGLRFEDWQT